MRKSNEFLESPNNKKINNPQIIPLVVVKSGLLDIEDFTTTNSAQGNIL